MEVTNKNFDEVLKLLPSLLKKALFVSIDTEFTGLHVQGNKWNYFHTLKEFYYHNRVRAIDFLIVQVGICIFEYDTVAKKFIYHAFNFHVFPTASSEKQFSCQVSCMRFLAEHGCDFNKLFLDGIPYLTQDEAEAKLEHLEKRHRLENESAIVPRGKEKGLHLVEKAIEHFISDKAQTEAIVADSLAPYMQILIIQYARERFEDILFVADEKARTIKAIKCANGQERREKENKMYKDSKSQVEKDRGFSYVIQLLSQSRLPIVGHNLFMDLVHIMHHFLTPLPESFEEFRDILHDLFPKVIDTKHAAATDSGLGLPYRETKLQDLYARYANDRKRVVEGGEFAPKFDDQSSKYHDAAYDAYITGLVFISMVFRLEEKNHVQIFGDKMDSPVLAPVINKLYIPMLHKLSFITLDGDYKEVDRNDVFHVSIPKEWTTDHIKRLFKDTGYLDIRWLDETSALMGVEPNYLNKFKKMLKSTKNSLCTVTTFNEYIIKTYGKSETDKNNGKGKKREAEAEDLGEVVNQKKQ